MVSRGVCAGRGVQVLEAGGSGASGEESCLAALVQLLWYLLLDARGVNSPWEGWEGSAMITVAQWMHRGVQLWVGEEPQ